MFALVIVAFVILLCIGGLGMIIANGVFYLSIKLGGSLILIFILVCVLFIGSKFW